jgi:thiol-disulfide isomerase/thioredoxin
MRRRALVAGAVAVLAITATLAILAWRDDAPDAAPTMREYPIGDRPAAPPIAGELLDGGRLDLADLRGEVVVVNVWASWCGPCRAETADLEEVHQATQQLGVSFVGISLDTDRDKAIGFMAGRVTYPSIFDPPFEIGLGFRDPPAPVGPPATLVIDRNGDLAVAIYRQVGRTELEQAVTRVAAEEDPNAESVAFAPAPRLAPAPDRAPDG